MLKLCKKKINILNKNNVVIHHGISRKFLNIKRKTLKYNKGDIYKLICITFNLLKSFKFTKCY